VNMFTFVKELSPKALETRERIAHVAMRQFARRGFEKTTMRDIARDAKCALGLTYRYFPTKEAIVLFVYEQTREELEVAVATLPEGTLGQRFRIATEAKLALLAPKRKAFLAVLGSALSPSNEVGVLSDATSKTRRGGVEIFRTALRGATNAPDDERIAPLLYALHLLVVLVWTQDTSKDGARAHAFLDEIERTIDVAAPFLALPLARDFVARAAALVAPLLNTRFAEVL